MTSPCPWTLMSTARSDRTSSGKREGCQPPPDDRQTWIRFLDGAADLQGIANRCTRQNSDTEAQRVSRHSTQTLEGIGFRPAVDDPNLESAGVEGGGYGEEGERHGVKDRLGIVEGN